jgi:hypothetical protein
MKQLLSLCFAFFTFQILFGQIQPSGQTEIKIKGKVVSPVVIPGHEYVYLFVDYQTDLKDSALIQFDSTFEFNLSQSPLPLAYLLIHRNSTSTGLLPKAGDLHIQMGYSLKKLDGEVDTMCYFLADLYYRLESLVDLPLSLVENKNLALIDSVDFNKNLHHLYDSTYQKLLSFNQYLHPKVYHEFERCLKLNNQIAYLDFALLKRLHQKEKTFDKVSSTYTQEARKILMDSVPTSFALKPWNKLQQRVQALESIDFQTSRFNPFEYQCEQIDREVLRKAYPQSDGLNCNYGLVGAVSFYLKQSQYQHGWLIIPRFENLNLFTNKYAIVMYNGRLGLIDACQNFTVQPQYSVLKEFKLGEEDSLPSLYIFRGARNYGLLDHTGRQLLEENYDYLSQLDASRLAYRPINGNKYGMIDTSGKKIMPPKYDAISAENSIPGYYKVYNRHPFLKNKRNFYGRIVDSPIQLIGLIDSLGKEVVNPGWYDFEQTPNFIYEFGRRTNLDGLIWEARRYSLLERSSVSAGKYGYINSKGSFILKPKFKFIYRADPNTRYVAATKKRHAYIYFPSSPEKATLKVDLLLKQLSGNALIKIEDAIYLIDSAGNYEKYGSFDEFAFLVGLEVNSELLRLKSAGKWGLFSLEKMQWVFTPQWDRIEGDWEGIFLEKNGKMAFSDSRILNTPTTLYDTVFQRSEGYYEARLGKQKFILDSIGNKVFETDADAIFHLNTGFFGDSNFVVKRGKQLFTLNGSQEKPLSAEKVGFYYLYDSKHTFGALVNKKGYILGYSSARSSSDLGYHNEDDKNIPDLGKGIWRIEGNGFEMLVDEEANIKIPPTFMTIQPYVMVFGEYLPINYQNTIFEDTLKPRRYVVRSKGYHYGVYDEGFNKILDTIYWSIYFKKNLLLATKQNGLYVKDHQLKDLAFIKNGRFVSEVMGERLTISFKNGKKGVYHLQHGCIIKPKFKNIYMESNGLILASKHDGDLEETSIYLYNAKGKRLAKRSYSQFNQGLGITVLHEKKEVYYNAQGKPILKQYGYKKTSARIPNFTSNLWLDDTIGYNRMVDTLHNLGIYSYSKNGSETTYKVVNDAKLSTPYKDVLNQIFYKNSDIGIIDIQAFDTVLSKIQLEYVTFNHYQYLPAFRQKTYYFDADSIYGIEAEGLILEEMEINFATQFVNEITKDKNIKWNACVKPERLFSHLSFQVDFTGAGLCFTTYSFEDIDGNQAKKSVSYTWQELSPYLNKNHVLAKRFFGSTPNKN